MYRRCEICDGLEDLDHKPHCRFFGKPVTGHELKPEAESNPELERRAALKMVHFLARHNHLESPMGRQAQAWVESTTKVIQGEKDDHHPRKQ